MRDRNSNSQCPVCAGQNYTIQTSTNLKSTNWTSLLVTNPPVNTFIFADTNATNPARYYRVLLGP